MSKPINSQTKKCKHTNIWIISGGTMLWCYECGAIRPNIAGNPKQKIYWQPPSNSKVNPAMADKYPALTWEREQL
jgi:hypothetical protein